MTDNFKWCSYNWKSAMDGGRIIHPSYPWYWYSSGTIRVCSDDVLELSVTYNPKEVKHWDGKIYNPTYEVATMRTQESFSFGTFSAEIMMPTGLNLSSSFWLSGNGNWPPEIDIEEGWTEEKKSWFRLSEAYFPWIKPAWRTTTNVHYRNPDMTKTHIGSRNISIFKQPSDPSNNFIEYKCDWRPDEIVFYANGKQVRKVSGDVCKYLTTNLSNPDKGYEMNVIFNVWCEDPSKNKIALYSPMKIRNFKYEPYTIYYRPK